MTPIETPTPCGGHVWGFRAEHSGTLPHQMPGIARVTSGSFEPDPTPPTLDTASALLV